MSGSARDHLALTLRNLYIHGIEPSVDVTSILEFTSNLHSRNVAAADC